MTSNIKGKRKRPNTEVDSGTESVGSNFQTGLVDLYSEDYVSSPRYNQPDPSNSPRGRFLMRSSVTYVDQTGLVDLYSEDIQHLNGREAGNLLYNISPSSTEYQVMARLAPETRKGALYEYQRLSETAELNWSFLPSNSSVTLIPEISSSDEDVHSFVDWEDQKLELIEGKLVRVDFTEEERSEKRNKCMALMVEEKTQNKNEKRKKMLEHYVSSPRFNKPDPSNPPRGRFLMRPINQTGLVDFYSDDIQHLDGIEAGTILHNIDPSSSAYQVMARLGPERRKTALFEYQRRSETAHEQHQSNTYFPVHNQLRKSARSSI